MEFIAIRDFVFQTTTLQERNPFNDTDGAPLPDHIEESYAWCEAAYLYRTGAIIL